MKNKILLGLATIGLTGSVSAQTYDCPMGGMMYGLYGGYGTGMMVFSWISSLLVIGLIAAGIYWLIKSANKKK